MFVQLEHHDMSPKFGQKKDIVHVEEIKRFFFCVEVYEGYSFSTHYNAFGVRNTSVRVIDIQALQDHHYY